MKLDIYADGPGPNRVLFILTEKAMYAYKILIGEKS